MPDRPLWIGEDEVKRLLSMREAIDVLDATYRLQEQDGATNMRRAHLREGPALLHAVGGAISGLGTRYLARWDAATLAVLGTGKQSVSQAEAVICERPIERIRLFGSTRWSGCVPGGPSREAISTGHLDPTADPVLAGEAPAER